MRYLRVRAAGLASCLVLLWGCGDAVAQTAATPAGRLTAPQPARVAVEKLPCNCEADSVSEADVLLVTLGTESVAEGQRHFHPIVSLAFDRLLADEEPGQWVALWNFGPSAAGWRRTLRSFFPIPARPPKASRKELGKLAARLEQLRSGEHLSAELVPEPYTDLSRLKPATASQGVTMGLKRVLNWLDLFNPGQLLLRTFLLQRADRNERAFQRAYLGLAGLIDVEFDGDSEPGAWLAGINDVRFHLLRNRSFFGRWVRHSDSFELVYNYDSKVREALAKGSSWLQADANEYYLHYEPIQRYTANGAAVPVGGTLYYDARKAPTPQQARWPTPNVFDLAYNPFTHPEIQRRAQENPEQLVPLALYGFQSELGLRPIILTDFWAPNNPRLRETSQQAMTWLREWLLVSAGFLSPERFAYRAASYVANKKAFTLLVNKSARLGVEELRLALESHLYFEPQLRRDLMRRVDRRVLNPLVKSAEVEELLAELQYESLRAEQARAVCQVVKRVRRKMAERFNIPKGVVAAERWARVRVALDEGQQRRRIRDLLARGFDELGGLEALQEPLAYFENLPSADPESAQDLRSLYAQLFQQQFEMPDGWRLEQLRRTSERVAQVWARVEAARGRSPTEFERKRARVESAERARWEKEQREQQEERVRTLHEFLKEAHIYLGRAGCSQSEASPAEVEMYLEILRELPVALRSDPALEREFRKHARQLERDLARWERALAQCPPDGRDPWRVEHRQATLTLVEAAAEQLFANRKALSANGAE